MSLYIRMQTDFIYKSEGQERSVVENFCPLITPEECAVRMRSRDVSKTC